MTLLDARLEGRKFIAADITAVVAVDFARVVRIKPSEQHVNLRKARGGGIAGLGWGLVTPPLVMGRAPRFSALALLE